MMMKKVIVLMSVFSLFVCGCVNTNKEKDPKEDEKVGYCDDSDIQGCGLEQGMDMSAYKGFNDSENVFVKSSMEEAISIFKEKKSAILYFGFSTCPWCIEALPIMNQCAKDHNRSIYYIETRDQDKKLLYTEEDKKQLFPYLNDYLKTNDEGKKHLFVPFVVVVKEGKVMDAHIGTIEDHEAKERKLNEKEKEQLYNIYDEMMKKG